MSIGKGTGKIAKLIVGTILARDMALKTGDSNWIARNFNEDEPNNTEEQANDIGKILSEEPVHISGHVNNSGDPYDYFNFTAAEDGQIWIRMYKNVPYGSLYSDDLIYEKVHDVQANDQFFYWAEAGTEEFNYDTYIEYAVFA